MTEKYGRSSSEASVFGTLFLFASCPISGEEAFWHLDAPRAQDLSGV